MCHVVNKEVQDVTLSNDSSEHVLKLPEGLQALQDLDLQLIDAKIRILKDADFPSSHHVLAVKLTHIHFPLL